MLGWVQLRYKTTNIIVFVMGVILISAFFQSCAGGHIIGNPIHTEIKRIRFSTYKSTLESANLCLNNIVFELSAIESKYDIKNQILAIPKDANTRQFDMAYLYYDPGNKRYYYSGVFFNNPLTLNRIGTEIGDFLLPIGTYERVTFGFLKCSYTGDPSIRVTPTVNTYADNSGGFFALNYSTRVSGIDINRAFNEGFQIEHFTDQLAQVKSQQNLLTVLEPYRSFDLVGFSSTTIQGHVEHHLRSLVEISDTGRFAAGGYASRARPNDLVDREGAWVVTIYDKFGQHEASDVKYKVFNSNLNADINLDGHFEEGGIYGLVSSTNGSIFAAGLASYALYAWQNYDFGVQRLFAPIDAPSFGTVNWSVEDQSIQSGKITDDRTNDIAIDEFDSVYVVGPVRTQTGSTLGVFDRIAFEKLDSQGDVKWKKSYPYVSSHNWADMFNNMSLTYDKNSNRLMSVSTSGGTWRFDRLDPANGLPDVSFGNNGIKFINFSEILPWAYNAVPVSADIIIQNDVYCEKTNKTENKIIAVGWFDYSRKGVQDFVAVRLNWDGTPDACFGDKGNGFIHLSHGTNIHSYGKGVAINKLGQIIFSGILSSIDTNNELGNNIFIVKLTADGKTILNQDGLPSIRFFATNSSKTDGSILIRKSDESIIIGGSVVTTDPSRNGAYHVIVLSP
jgi:Domain of unknown function (DUF5122) beta-propeller